MPQCPSCGESVSLKQNFCRSCGEPIENRTENSEQSIDTPIQETQHRHIAEEHGEYVTPEHIEKIKDVLDENEKVHYLTRGSTVDVEGSSAGTSLFGDNRSRKSGTRGYVRAAITDGRVVVKIPQWLGSDERSIPYQNITSVDLDTGFVTKRLTLQTPGQTYHIEAHEPDKSEIREVVKFIRDKVTSSQQESGTSSGAEPDPTEQLRNIKELHEEGVLSDAEFESKKQTLLDRIQ